MQIDRGHGRRSNAHRRRGRVLVAMAATAVLLAALPAEAVVVEELPFASGFGVSPVDIAVGSDGALWFTLTNAAYASIGRMTTGGAFTEFLIPTVHSNPRGIAAGPDGALWFTEGLGNKIGRITTSGQVTEFAIPTADSWPIGGIVAGPDGALWFTETLGNKIGRITTAGAVSEFPIPTAGSGPAGITVGPDGALWFTEGLGNKIGRITTGGVITEFAIPTVASGPGAIAKGPDGALWFTQYHGNRIGRIATDGTVTEFATPGRSPQSITAGPDGALWVTASDLHDNGGRILRVTTAGAVTESRTPSLDSRPWGITVGPDGALWFTEFQAERIGRARADASTFADVVTSHPFSTWIEALVAAGITGGCSTSPPQYCPEDLVTRGQMAVFLLRAKRGASYAPPAAKGTMFADVPATHPFAAWIEQLAREGITSGCATGPARYCPDTTVTRAQMAVFLLRAKLGATYQPPAATGSLFADVPAGQSSSSWIEELAREGITAGCSASPSLYCPDSTVTRGQMAVFLVRTFNLL